VRLRGILRWNFTPCDLARLSALAAASAVLVALDAACAALERFIDEQDPPGWRE
jgi:hypothetical protein